MKYENIFLDFDDTLYDTYGNAVIALRETFQQCGLDRYFTRPQTFYDAYWTANIDLWTRYSKGEISRDYLIAERFRRPMMESEKFRTESKAHAEGAQDERSQFSLDFSLRLSDIFLQHCASKPGVIDGAHQLMKYLRQKGYTLHICSNGFHEVQYKKLTSCGLQTYFDSIILSEDAGANKPARRFFDYALTHSGAKPQNTVMIGDNLNTDIVGARNAGIDTILFNKWAVEPAGIPTYTVESLYDIMKIL